MSVGSFDWTQMVPNIVTGLVSGGFSGLLSAWVTYRLAFRRFRAEKSWERRADAYSRIFEALHHSKKFADTHITYIARASELPPEKDEELRKCSQAGEEEILRAIDIGRLFLSSAALVRLKRFVRESENVDEGKDFLSYLAAESKLIEMCLDEVAQLARDDLGTT